MQLLVLISLSLLAEVFSEVSELSQQLRPNLKLLDCFEYKKNYWLVGQAFHTRSVQFKDECLRVCLSSTLRGSPCLSAMHIPGDDQCVISDQDQLTRPDLFVENDADHSFTVSYFRNTCIDPPTTNGGRLESRLMGYRGGQGVLEMHQVKGRNPHIMVIMTGLKENQGQQVVKQCCLCRNANSCRYVSMLLEPPSSWYQVKGSNARISNACINLDRLGFCHFGESGKMSTVTLRNLLDSLKLVTGNGKYLRYYTTDFKDFSRVAMAAHINLGQLYAGKVSNLVLDLQRLVSESTDDELRKSGEFSRFQETMILADSLSVALLDHLRKAESHYKLTFGREAEGQVYHSEEASQFSGPDAFNRVVTGIEDHLLMEGKEIVETFTGVAPENSAASNLKARWLELLNSSGSQLDDIRGKLRTLQISSEVSENCVTEKLGLKQESNVEPSVGVGQLAGASQSDARCDRLVDLVIQLVQELNTSRNTQRESSSYRNELNMEAGIQPKGLEFQPFSGADPEEFEGWWQMFEIVIGQNPNLSPTAKLLYLKSYMIEEAKDVIDALPLTAECYKVACTTLQKRFGFFAICYDLAYLKLIELSAITIPHNAEALRRLYHKQFAQYQRIIGKGKSFPMGYMQLCLEPYPAVIQTKMRQARVEYTQDHKRTMPSDLFMSKLGCIIQVYAEVEMDHKGTFETQAPFRGVSRSNQSVTFNRNGWNCRLCLTPGHKEYRCQRYRTAAQRAQFVSESGLCPKCYLSSHEPEGCSQGSCNKCNGEHGVAICPM